MFKFLKSLREKGDWKTLLFHSSWSLTLTAGLSYFFGLMRDRLFAHSFGLSRTLDIYNASFVIPDLMLNILIGTALSAAFLPLFSGCYDRSKKEGFDYARQIISWGFLVVSAVGIGVAITLPLFAHWLVPGFSQEDLSTYILLTRIMLFSPVLFTLSNIYGRMILSFREFFWYGLSPALYNLGIVLGVLFFVPTFGITGLILGNLLGILMHLSIRFLIIRRKKYAFRHGLDFRLSPAIRETVKLMLPKVAQYFMWSYLLIRFTCIASALDEGSIAAYNYARNFQSLPVSMLGIAIALSLYTSLSHDAGKGNFEKFIRDFKRDRIRSLFYTSLAAVALAVVSRPVISLLFEGGAFGGSDVHLVAVTLQIYCISIPLESLLHIYHRSFYSIRNTWIPAVFHAVALGGTIVLAEHLSVLIGVYALPVAFSAGLFIHVTLMALIFPFILKKQMKVLMLRASR